MYAQYCMLKLCVMGEVIALAIHVKAISMHQS